MSDLISRSALIEVMRKKEEEFESVMCTPNWWTAFDVIENQPPAYDVEKVVAELEQQRELYRRRGIESVHKGMAISSKEHLMKQLSFEHAIKIVKNGYIVYMNNIIKNL